MEERRFEGLDPRELERHRAWLQRLAVAILRDANQAEDCVQDVFLTALRGRPEPTVLRSSLRAWLKRVLVNRAHRELEREAARRYHEALALAERDPVPARGTPEHRELEAELHRGVHALEPRYRDVVLLRHEKSLTPSQIADHLRVPIKTVNSWLYRAYAKLRARLDGRFEGLRGWAPLALGLGEGLGPIAKLAESARTPRPESGTFARPQRSARLPVVAAGLTAVLGGALLLRGLTAGGRSSEALAAAPATTADATSTTLTLPEAVLPGAASARADVAPAALHTEGETPSAPAAPTREWHGRVLDAEGAPVAGLTLRFEPLTPADVLLFSDRASAGYEELLQRVGRGFEPQLPAGSSATPDARASAADGRFALPAPESLGWVAVEDARWSTVTTALALALPPVAEAEVRVAPARRVTGRVLDGQGRPLASVRVELRLPERFLAAESGVPTRIAHEPSTFTDANGAFAFERAPDLADASLRFRASGYEPAEKRLGACGRTPPETLEVVLRADAPELVIAGRTLDARGAPLAGVFLSFEWSSTATSDADGSFRLRLPEGRPLAAGTLRAAARGFQPLERPLASRDSAWPPVELVFEAEALALAGVVRRADGTPHANAAVWVPAPAALAVLGNRPPIFLEHVMSGPQDGGSLEATLTDAEGRFRVRGLLERDYVLRVADLETREWFATEPLPAGLEDLELAFEPGGCHPEVRGVLVGRDGTPIVGARIARSYPRLDAPLPDGRRYQSRFAGEPVEVGADGRFMLANVARRGGVLSIFGPELETRHVELEREPDPSALELVIGRICRVAVEDGGLGAERFSFRSESGGSVEFQAAVRGAGTPLTQAPLNGVGSSEGRSAEYLVPDIATELVLFTGTRELARLPLDLRPGELNLLQP